MFQFSVPNKGDCNIDEYCSDRDDLMFQFSVPNKGDCNFLDMSEGVDIKVSILSPQQRGLQFGSSFPGTKRKFSFNSQSPTKGTAITIIIIEGDENNGFNSQSPTKGTAMAG